MEINLINEVFFLNGAINAKLYHEALQKGRNVSIQLTINKSKYEVFVPELFNILNAKEIPLTDGRVIDGTQYVDVYIEGYKNGVEYFKNEFPETHLMMNSDFYFSSLHYCYFHKAPNFSNGWAYWINSYPMSISAKEIERYGFCAGIKFSLNHLKDKNPTLFKKIEDCEHDLLPKQVETKTDKLKAELGKFGFFEMHKVKQLPEPNKHRLVELIGTKGLPYSIAMFDFLGFLKYIENEHFNSKYKLNKEIAKWFNSDKEGRAVKGNISSLSEYSKEDKNKYTAHTHKETVKNDYRKLK